MSVMGRLIQQTIQPMSVDHGKETRRISLPIKEMDFHDDDRISKMGFETKLTQLADYECNDNHPIF